MTDERNRDEIDERLARVLDADAVPGPLRPMWPEVERRRSRGRAFDLRFATASVATVAVGFLIGAFTFNGNGATPIEGQTAETASVAVGVDWSDTGPRIDQLYLLETPADAQESEVR